MDLAALLRVLLQRWYVVVVVMIMTAVAAVYVITSAKPEYQANIVVLLRGPGQAAQDAVNPAAIAEVVQGGDVRETIDADVPYTVEVVGEGQILRVTASNDSSDGVVSTVNAVLEAIQLQTNQRQEDAGIPEGQRVAARILATPSEARSETVFDDVSGTEVASFTASGSVLFSLASAESTSPFPPTAYTLRILQETIQSPEATQALIEQGAEASVLPTFEPRDSAPIMYLDVTGSDPDVVMHTVDEVLRLVDDELDRRQANASVPAAERTTAERISMPTSAELSSSNLLRPLVTVIGLGVIAALAIAVATEGTVQAINRRKYGVHLTADPESTAPVNSPAEEMSDIQLRNGAPPQNGSPHPNDLSLRTTHDQSHGTDQLMEETPAPGQPSAPSMPDATETVEFRLPRTTDQFESAVAEEDARWRQGGHWHRPDR